MTCYVTWCTRYGFIAGSCTPSCLSARVWSFYVTTNQARSSTGNLSTSSTMRTYLQYKQVVFQCKLEDRDCGIAYTTHSILYPHRHINIKKYYLLLRLWNTRKISYISLWTPSLCPVYLNRMHLRNYNYFVYRELQEQIIQDMQQLFSPFEYVDLIVNLKVMPGFRKFTLRAFLWMLRRARRNCRLLSIEARVPRAHGFRTLTKVARRKKRLNKARAKRIYRAR